MFVRGVRAAIALGVVAAALTHAVAGELLPLTGEFFSGNTIEPGARTLLIGLSLAALGLTALIALFLARRAPDHDPSGLEWLARLLSPLILVPFAMPLARRGFAGDIETAILLAFFVLAFERLSRESLGAYAEQPIAALQRVRGWVSQFFLRPRLVLGMMVLLAVGHAIYMGTWAVWAHQRFATYGYDLGQYDQIFTSVLKGEPLRLPSLQWDYVWGGFNGHADLGTFYMIPLYALHPRATTLLVMQSTMLAMAAVPLFLFAKNRLPIHWAFALGICWLLYPPLHGAQLYDVHMQPFGAAWAMFAIAAIEYRKWVLFWIFFTLSILVREDVSIGWTMFGAYMFLSGYRVKSGFATAAIACCYFLGLRFGLMHNQYFADTFKGLYPVGEAGFGAVIKTMVSNPGYTAESIVTWEKIRYVCQIFVPMAFLPQRRPILWLLFVPGFILTLLSTDYLPTIQIGFQYVCNWATYGFIATAIVLGSFAETSEGRRRRGAGAMAAIAGSVLACLQWGAYSPHDVVHGGFVDVPRQRPTARDLQRHEDLQELMNQVPEKVKLCAADRIQPHITWHHDTWTLRDGLFECVYLLYSDIPGDLGNDRGMAAVASGAYEVIATKPGIWLAKKKAPVPPPEPVAPVPAPVP